MADQTYNEWTALTDIRRIADILARWDGEYEECLAMSQDLVRANNYLTDQFIGRKLIHNPETLDTEGGLGRT